MLVQMDALDEVKGFCIICLLVLNLLQIFLLCILLKKGDHKKFHIHLFLALIVFISIPIIEGYFWKVPSTFIIFFIIFICAFVFIFSAYIVSVFILEIRFSNGKLTNNAIKEAFDTLPAGIAFFSEQGMPILCNKKIHEIAYLIMGKDLQSFYELENALSNPIDCVEKIYIGKQQAYRLEDGRVESFIRKDIYDNNGIKYIQIVTTNLTELYQLQKELNFRNDELQRMIERIQRIAGNMVDITRQQEILTAKMRIHNKMGNSLLAMRRYIVQECPKEQKEKVLKIWGDTLDDLYHEIGQKDEMDVFEEVIRIGRIMGVSIVISGKLPESSEMLQLLLIALRECLTNTVRHAKGNQLFLTISSDGETIKAVYSNNGKAPEDEIVEGGGLSSLREKIEHVEGTMRVQSFPVFKLIIELSEKEAELW